VTTRDLILAHLTSEFTTAQAIADAIDKSPVTVRQVLKTLLAEKLVTRRLGAFVQQTGFKVGNRKHAIRVDGWALKED